MWGMSRDLVLTSRRGGFTLMELLLVVVCLGILTALAAPKVGQAVARSKVNQAAGVLSGDLEQAITLAARRRRPMVLTTDGAGSYTVRDRATSPNDSLRLRRVLSVGADAGATTVTFAPTTVQIFPTGALSAPLTVTVTGAGHTRIVTVSTAGLVRAAQ